MSSECNDFKDLESTSHQILRIGALLQRARLVTARTIDFGRLSDASCAEIIANVAPIGNKFKRLEKKRKHTSRKLPCMAIDGHQLH